MKSKPATLNSKDIALIKIAVADVSLISNRETRKRIRDLEKEVKTLREKNKILEAYVIDGEAEIKKLRDGVKIFQYAQQLPRNEVGVISIMAGSLPLTKVAPPSKGGNSFY